MRQGWICLHRKALDSQVWQNQGLWHLWCYCLLKANHEPQVWSPVSGVVLPIKIKRGQFITGRKSLLEEVYPNPKKRPVSAKTLFRWLRFLEKCGNLSLKVSNRYTLVTICKYNTYQDRNNTSVQLRVPPVSHQCPASVQPVSTNNNNNKENNENKEREATPPLTRTYLDFVVLSDKEHTDLTDRLGLKKTNEWIEELNNAIGAGRLKKDRSHYYTILSWDQRERKENNNSEEEPIDRLIREQEEQKRAKK